MRPFDPAGPSRYETARGAGFVSPDHAFFVAHPGRAYRLRAPLASERAWVRQFAPYGADEIPLVAVHRFPGGCWLILGRASAMPPDTDATALAVFDAMHRFYCKGGKASSIAAIVDRAATVGTGVA